MIDLTKQFDEFIEQITLDGKQVVRMDSAVDAISGFLRSKYGLSEADVFLQGSYANGTAVEPVDGGEYDVDIVCVCAHQLVSADAALEELEQTFRADGNYARRVVPKKPCVRLEYAEDEIGKFHVDVVPVRPSQSGLAPLEAPRRDAGWHDTNPKAYTEWCRKQGDAYSRTVKAMKRWRSEQQSVHGAIKSILLQVLVAECMPRHLTDDGERLAHTLIAMKKLLERHPTPPVVPNPVLSGENLAARWEQPAFESFKAELKEAAAVASDTLKAETAPEACDLWRAILGDDFPVGSSEVARLALGDRSHLRGTSTGTWIERLDARYGVSISATYQRGRRDKFRKTYRPGAPIVAGNWIRFKAHVTAPDSVQVYWQVANTGGHARDDHALRGDYLRANAQGLGAGASSDQTVHWEHTRYTGVHLVRAVLLRGNTVVAKSEFLRVDILNPKVRFRL